MLLKALFGVFLLESLVLIEQERDFFLHIAHAENQTGPGLGIRRANLRIHLSQLLYILSIRFHKYSDCNFNEVVYGTGSESSEQNGEGLIFRLQYFRYKNPMIRHLNDLSRKLY